MVASMPQIEFVPNFFVNACFQHNTVVPKYLNFATFFRGFISNQ